MRRQSGIILKTLLVKYHKGGSDTQNLKVYYILRPEAFGLIFILPLG